MGTLLLEDDAEVLLEDGGEILLEGDTMARTLSLLPMRVPKSATSAITFIGGGTSWLSAAPTFTPSGAPADDAAWQMGTPSIVSDTLAIASITTGPTGGAVTFVDSTTGATSVLTVGAAPPIVTLRPAAALWYRGGR